MDARFHLSLAFCDARKPDATAQALRALEREAEDRRALLPSKDLLRKHGWREYARSFWGTLRPLMESTP
jgi:hypothetical protein